MHQYRLEGPYANPAVAAEVYARQPKGDFLECSITAAFLGASKVSQRLPVTACLPRDVDDVCCIGRTCLLKPCVCVWPGRMDHGAIAWPALRILATEGSEEIETRIAHPGTTLEAQSLLLVCTPFYLN